jgi:hypothetical protein
MYDKGTSTVVEDLNHTTEEIKKEEKIEENTKEGN